MAEKIRYCRYHPEEPEREVKKYTSSGKYMILVTCDECEWNPPDLGSSDIGRTSPDIKNFVDRLEE